ncbi:MAG TPA: response regulator [Phycisphaerae bacterium]|nr:response regulator [Phycisphaerae bacterium]
MSLGNTAYVIDDDPSIRSLIEATLQAEGIAVRTFASAEEFAGFTMPDGVSCILLDLEMPGLSGLEFLEKHFQGKSGCPVIVVTAHGSVPAAVKSLKLGAVDFLEKPFERPVLIKAVTTALEADRVRREAIGAREEVRKRLASLSKREAELLGAVIDGKSTKMIADELGISARTVDHHRANLMAKMRAANVADLVRMSVEAGFAAKPPVPPS